MGCKYCSIDIETTGVNLDNCDIIEFGCVVDELGSTINVNKLPTYHCYFVKQFYQGEPFALSMHSKILKRIADREKGYTYMSVTKFGNSFKQFLLKNGFELENDKVIINVAGKNFGSFDLQFLNKQTDLSKHVIISNRILDPSILFLKNKDKRLPCLSECKKRANMPENVSHDAVSDARDIVVLLRKALEHKFY